MSIEMVPREDWRERQKELHTSRRIDEEKFRNAINAHWEREEAKGKTLKEALASWDKLRVEKRIFATTSAPRHMALRSADDDEDDDADLHDVDLAHRRIEKWLKDFVKMERRVVEEEAEHLESMVEKIEERQAKGGKCLLIELHHRSFIG